MKKPNKKALIFDFDGTLVDSFRAVMEIFNEMSGGLKLEKIQEQDMEKFRNLNAEELFRSFHIPRWKLPYVIWKARRKFHKKISELSFFDSIPDVMRELKAKGFFVGILTSNSKENVECLLRDNKLEIFDFVQGVSIFGKAKALNKICEKYQIDKENMIYVGDESRDIEAAKKFGIKCAAVSWGFNSRKLLEKYQPDFLVDRPEEILEITERANLSVKQRLAKNNVVVRIGHRGAMGYAPENTLLSFRKALELKVDMVELDVYSCKTGELVVIHDDKVDRTTNGHGDVVKKTFEELRDLDAGQGEKIPTLEEVFDLVNRKVKINIELKGPGTAKSVCELIEDYVKNKNWQYDDFAVSSFDYYELKEFSRLNPNIKIGMLTKKIPVDFSELTEKMNIFSVNICVRYINKFFVDDMHGRGLKVYVWTVDDPEDIKRMKDFGVDGIFSNYPDRL